MPGVPALLPSYASIDDPVADLRAACLAAVADLGPRVRVLASDAGPRVARALLAEVGAVEALAIRPGSWWSATARPNAPSRRRATSTSGPRSSTTTSAARCIEPLPAALSGIDEQLAEELWADVAGIRALGDLLTPADTAEVAYDDAPYGVQYWVIRWW